MKTMILQMVAFVLYASLAAQIALGAKQEIIITNATGDQQMPAIWQSEVVWEGMQLGNWAIFLRDVADPQSPIRRLAAFGEDRRNPSIWENTIVWQKKSSAAGDWDIDAADISDMTDPMAFSVSRAPTLEDWASLDEQYPRIWGTSIVYQAFYEGNWILRLVDISNPASPTHLRWQNHTLVNLQYPAISGDLIVSQYKSEAGSSEIIAYDREDPNRIGAVAFTENDQLRPAIYANWVVWQDDYNGDWDIRGLENNLLSMFSLAVCEKRGSNATSPAIWNNVVVWQDDRNSNWDIYGYNLATKKEFRITDSNKDQINPAISFSPTMNKYVVVWQDNRNGNWDIYGALLDGAEVAGCASPSAWDVNADAIVDAKDVGEVQEHVGERNGISP